MHTWVRRALCALGLTGGALLLGFLMAESASAAGNHTNGQDGIGSGNQTGIGVQAPVNATGNQITVIGHDNHATNSGDAASAGGTTPSGGTTGGDNTSGQDGIGSGNQTGAPVEAPVNASGNQVTVVGDGNTADSSGGTSVVSPPTTGESGKPGGHTPGSTGSTGQVSPPSSNGSTGIEGGPAASAATVAPVAGVLPNTGAPGDAAGLAGLALALLAGGVLLLRRRAVGC